MYSILIEEKPGRINNWKVTIKNGTEENLIRHFPDKRSAEIYADGYRDGVADTIHATRSAIDDIAMEQK